MDKVRIADRVERGEPGYAPLMPVVQRILSRGGRLLDDKTLARAFSDTPNGYLCTIVTETSVDELTEQFDFPDHFVVGVPVDGCIWDKRHNAQLCLTRP